jgi:hypothetical protein
MPLQTCSSRKQAPIIMSASPSQPTKHLQINQNLLHKQQDVLQTTRITEIIIKRKKKSKNIIKNSCKRHN